MRVSKTPEEGSIPSTPAKMPQQSENVVVFVLKGVHMVERIVGDINKSNVFVVGNDESCFIVDAGANLDAVKKVVGQRKVCAILLTHAHYDHFFYVMDYLKEFGCQAFCSENAKEYFLDEKKSYAPNGLILDDYSNFVFLSGNGKIEFGDFCVDYFSVGGHTKSDTLFQFEKDLFVGDVLIGRDMGRIDLYGGDKSEMVKTFENLLELNYEVMHSGHGDDNKKSQQDIVIKTWMRFLKR